MLSFRNKTATIAAQELAVWCCYRSKCCGGRFEENGGKKLGDAEEQRSDRIHRVSCLLPKSRDQLSLGEC